MTSTELIPHRVEPSSAPHHVHDEGPGELVGLAGVVPGEGPPILLLAAPLVLFALALAGPFLVILTLLAAVALGAILVALAAAIVASPFLLARRVNRYRHARGERRAQATPAAPFLAVESARSSA